MHFVPVLAAASAWSCSSPTAPSEATLLTLPLASSAWETISDPQPFPLANESGALTFDFPTDGSINYLFTASPIKIVRGTLTVALRVTTNGPVLFTPLNNPQTNCTIPPTVRPLIWANDNGEGSYDRWWSNPRSFTLTSDTATITVPLEPSAWSSVNGLYGNANPTVTFSFEKALLNVSRFGLTFGGGCSFGHGIRISGGVATFALTDYRIQ